MDFSQAKIKNLIIHEIGNKSKDEKLFLSTTLQTFTDELEAVLLNYFLKPFFSNKELLHFSHASDVKLNEVYSYSQDIFTQNSMHDFIKNSKNIARHLYEHTQHPKINRGELIIVEIKDIKFEDEISSVIGIFKSENKDTFLKVLKHEETINIKGEDGINISKMEKGCLIFNQNSQEGFTVLNIDNTSQHTEYWTHKFLNVRAINNSSHKTKEMLKICKNFAHDILSENYDTEREFTFNNDFISYLEDNESFDIDNFADEVFNDDKMKKDFFDYHETNKNSFALDFNDSFDLSQPDVKKEKKKINNVIKLDTNLELKVLIDKENGTKNIEKGFDQDKGMSFYKIYFNEEIE